jgi:lysophospholipase L1-like esterase
MRQYLAGVTMLAAMLGGCGEGSSSSSSGQATTGSAVLLVDSQGSLAAPSAKATTSAAVNAGWKPMLDALKAAIGDGGVRTVRPLAVEAATTTDTSSNSTFVTIRHDDPRLRLLGGKWAVGPAWPSNQARMPQAITPWDPGAIDANGFSNTRYGNNNGLEFTLPAGQSQFELVLLSSGTNKPIALEVDGFATNESAYDAGLSVPGTFKYTRFRLPPSTTSRKIRIWTATRPLVGLRLPAGETLGPLPQRPHPFSMVFQGDSITEGAVSRQPSVAYPVQAAYRLGVDDPVVVAIGGSGYLRFRGTGGYNFRQRLSDVTTAINGGPPDAVVVAGGINDCGLYSNAAIGSEALTYFRSLRAAAPNMTIFVVGPFTSWSGWDYTFLAPCRNAIFAAADQVPGTYTIDVSKWVTLQNRDIVFNGNVNGPHPLDGGHYIYGQKLAEAIAKIAGARLN